MADIKQTVKSLALRSARILAWVREEYETGLPGVPWVRRTR